VIFAAFGHYLGMGREEVLRLPMGAVGVYLEGMGKLLGGKEGQSCAASRAGAEGKRQRSTEEMMALARARGLRGPKR